MTTPLMRFLEKRKWPYETLAARVTYEVARMTPDGVAERVNSSMVGRWARGLTTPTLPYALAIRKVCGRSVPLESLVVWR